MRKLLNIFKDSSQSFHGQEAGEKVILLLRRHPFVIYLPLAILLLMCLVPIAIWLSFATLIHKQALVELFFFLSSLWYMIFWFVGFYLLTIYALNTVVITDRRIVENEQRGFFDRKVSELHVYRVQDVSVVTQGIFETFIGYGNIIVQTAGSEKQFTFRKIGNPEKVKDAIMQIVSTQFSGVKPLL